MTSAEDKLDMMENNLDIKPKNAHPVPGVSTEGGAGARSQLWVGSIILNKILGVLPKREFSLSKLQKCSQNGSTPRNMTPFSSSSIETKSKYGHGVPSPTGCFLASDKK